MPKGAMKVCRQVGCGRLIDKAGYCTEHEKEVRRAEDKFRESSHKRGYGAQWRKARAWHLKQSPLCVHCLAAGVVTAATDVDHIRPHKGDTALFWDTNNWQSLCHPCHSRKTASEDGGRGNSTAY